jgi:hypothetical protein
VSCFRLQRLRQSTDLLMIAQISADERSVTIVSGRPEDLFGAAPR